VTSTGPAALRWEGDTRAGWQRRWRVPRLCLLAETGSTNDEARALAQAGAPAGTVVIADYQSAGRGREGRRWQAAPGESLLLSIVLRPADPGEKTAAGPAPIRVGLAACRAIERVTGLRASLKWPNDLLAPDGRKLAGILCEAVSGSRPFVIAGIGINVRQPESAWPPELAGRATSLRAVAAALPGRAALAGEFIDALRPFTLGPPELDVAELDAFRRHDALLGSAITIDGDPAGTAAGLRADGALLVRSTAGTRAVHSGTVRILRPTGAGPQIRPPEPLTTGTRLRP
jgi:BirA family biotin operon repressor/biotin-[acetyl-CoA-carboxylase] ligase